jgi:hypothetical protein
VDLLDEAGRDDGGQVAPVHALEGLPAQQELGRRDPPDLVPGIMYRLPSLNWAAAMSNAQSTSR